MVEHLKTVGRRERGKEEKRARITHAARSLFDARGVDGVTTQEIADTADVAIGTLFRYAASKAELLIMVQNENFAAAVDAGIRESRRGPTRSTPPIERIMALLSPVIRCVRERPENGRLYLHELVCGDPAEEHRAAGLMQAWRLEASIAEILSASPQIDRAAAATLARVVSSIIHVTSVATIHLNDTQDEVIENIRTQVAAILPHET